MDPGDDDIAKKKRRGSSDEARDNENASKRPYYPSFPTSQGVDEFGGAFERMVGGIWQKMEPVFRQEVSKEIERMVLSNIHSLLPSISKQHESGKEVTTGSGSGYGALKFKLCFFNPIASLIFTNNEIKSENGEPLRIVICDTTNSNAIISTGPLSSAPVEFFLLPGEFGSRKRRDDETPWTFSDFNKSILTPREGKRPLIIGNDLQQLYLQNGVGIVNNLIVTDNSSWMKSKMFCLGVKIKESKFLVEIGRIGEAVSQPFRVMDQRGEGNQKHHPPTREDEVWRLEGIGKDGTYHTNLSSHGIMNVGDFLDAYRRMGPASLKTILGKRVLDKTWNIMIKNAEECIVDINVPSNYDQTTQASHFVETGVEANSNKNLEVHEQKQSLEANNLVETEMKANLNQNFEGHDQNQSFEANNLKENEVQANCKNNFEIHEQKQNYETNNVVENEVENEVKASSKVNFEAKEQKQYGDNNELSVEQLLSHIDFKVTYPSPPLSPFIGA